jgi:hypothetical protein
MTDQAALTLSTARDDSMVKKRTAKRRVKRKVKRTEAEIAATAATAAVIDAIGGTAEVASLLGVTETAVSNYRSFGLFPAASFFVLRDELKARGIRANERLWNMKQRAA